MANETVEERFSEGFLTLNNTFFNRGKNSTLDKATDLDRVLRDKKFLYSCIMIFLITAGASVFLIYGVISSPHIAQWLAPLNEDVLKVIQYACLVLCGASLAVTLISTYDCFNTEKYKTPEENTDSNNTSQL